MNDVIERVAIALYESDGMMLAIYATGAKSWPHDREEVRERFRRNARAAIAAMREPTQKMLMAALPISREDLASMGGTGSVVVSPRAYTAMIDEALK